MIAAVYARHASGASHIHLWGGKLPPGAPLPPPGTITHRVKVASWSVTPVTWGYRLKPATALRRTLVLEPAAHEVPAESGTSPCSSSRLAATTWSSRRLPSTGLAARSSVCSGPGSL